MKTEQRDGADQVVRWLVAALLCFLAGHAPAQGSEAADRQALLSLSNNPLTGSLPSSSTNAGTSSALFVPVILTVSGENNSVYTSELTLTNRGGEEATLHYTYTAHTGGGSDTATDTLAPGQQTIQPDALEYLRQLGMPIPRSGNRLGTLRVEVSDSSDLSVSVRTTTKVPEGRAVWPIRGLPPLPDSPKRSICADCARTVRTAPTSPSRTWEPPRTDRSP